MIMLSKGGVKKSFKNSVLQSDLASDHMIILITLNHNNQKDQLFKTNNFFFIYDLFFFILLEL